MLASCSGSGSIAHPSTAPNVNATVGASSAIELSVTIFDPHAIETAKARNPEFVSPSINGVMAVAYTSPQASHPTPIAMTSTDVSSGSAACGFMTVPRTCMITLSTGPGTDDVVLSAYTTPPPFTSAATLSIGSLAGAVIAPNAVNAFTIALGGVISSFSFAPMSVSPSAASLASFPLYVQGDDAGGNLIVAGSADPYNNPVTVSVNETGGSGYTFVSLNGGANSPSVSVTQSSQTISINYVGGSPSGYSATVTESATGVASVTALMITPLSPNGTVLSGVAIPSPNINEYALSAGTHPGAIVSGPDGALWFTEPSANQIGRITTGGISSAYGIPTSSANAGGITSGPDGALWFTETAVGKIGRVTTAGAVNEYVTSNTGPLRITTGPDGALWFSESSSSKIGRITTSGAFSEYSTPTSNSGPYGIAAGSDGALWFTENSVSKIGRITTSGVFSEYSIPTANSYPQGIALGPDGALWFAEQNVNQIGRITTSGTFTEYAISLPSSYPSDITAGSDGALWFTQQYATLNDIGRISTGGAVNEYVPPTPNSGVVGVTKGPDGAIWFTESSVNQIGRLP